MEELEHKTSVVRSWINIFLMILFIFGMGLFAFFIVGDRGQPGWQYGTVRDVPGQSPDAVYERQLQRQHIRGGDEE
jgi:hypothetical protein